jgi:hypothetical protein
MYLETLSSSDLVSLAEEYGIDIPENLARRFIITELLEAAEEANDVVPEDLQISDKKISSSRELPRSYNETQISVVLRNPVWCFAYWDIRDSELQSVLSTPSFTSLILRVTFCADDSRGNPRDSFDIPIASSDREQYVLLRAGERAFYVELIAEFKNVEPRFLARSKKVLLPRSCPEISSLSLDREVSPLAALSGLPELLRTHYINHRQSFS